MKFQYGFLGVVAAVVAGGPALADGPSGSLKDAPEPTFDNIPSPLGGFYGGIQAGYGWQDVDFDASENMLSDGKSVDTSGGFAGVYLGYDHYFAHGFLLGVETDWNYLAGRRHYLGGDLVPFAPPDVQAQWSGSVRARLGAIYRDNLFYLTGGVAFARFDASGFEFAGGLEKSSKTAVGWIAGVGMQRKIASNASIKLEYLYADYGDVEFRARYLPAPMKVDSTEHSVRLGIALHH